MPFGKEQELISETKELPNMLYELIKSLKSEKAVNFLTNL